MRVYSVGLVGERNYQSDIAASSPGERVTIRHEKDNPYDDLALRIDNSDGKCIGYIPRDNWLRDAVHKQGRGALATILDIKSAEGGLFGVVLSVTLTDDEIQVGKYGVRPRKRRSWFGLG